jgi:hypothetical protein
MRHQALTSDPEDIAACAARNVTVIKVLQTKHPATWYIATTS